MIGQTQIPLVGQSPKREQLSNPTKSLRCSGHVLNLQSVGESRLNTTNLSVRERSTSFELAGECPERLKRPTHPSKRLVAQLNADWRIVDDPLQWILQRKKGKPRKGNPGWRCRSCCRMREALLRCIREHCGEVDLEALAANQTLPDWHPDWERRNPQQNLDVPETDQAQAERDLKPLSSADLKAGENDNPAPRGSYSALL